MTKDEFKKKMVAEFFAWTSDGDRKESGWWSSLETYARWQFNVSYNRDYSEDKKEVD